jgi:hypothetical protein
MIEISEHDPALLGGTIHLDTGGDIDDACYICEETIGYPPNMDAHADDCSYKTGVWILEETVHHFFCDGCGEEHWVQYACPRCDRFFEDGDPYRVIDDDTGLVVPWVEAPGSSTAICIQCSDRQSEALIKRFGP